MGYRIFSQARHLLPLIVHGRLKHNQLTITQAQSRALMIERAGEHERCSHLQPDSPSVQREGLLQEQASAEIRGIGNRSNTVLPKRGEHNVKKKHYLAQNRDWSVFQ